MKKFVYSKESVERLFSLKTEDVQNPLENCHETMACKLQKDGCKHCPLYADVLQAISDNQHIEGSIFNQNIFVLPKIQEDTQ